WLTPYQLKRILAGTGRELVLGQYQILDELGRGGFGQVYKATHALMKRVVALKVIAPEWARDAESRKLFLREVVGVTRLVHPNIALAYDADEIDGTLFFAMGYVNGPSLERYVTDRGPLPCSCFARQRGLERELGRTGGNCRHDYAWRDSNP